MTNRHFEMLKFTSIYGQLKFMTNDYMSLYINRFYEFDPKGKGSKGKNKWMRLYQTKKLLHSKRNHQQNQKASNQMGDDICKQQFQQGVNIQNI